MQFFNAETNHDTLCVSQSASAPSPAQAHELLPFWGPIAWLMLSCCIHIHPQAPPLCWHCPSFLSRGKMSGLSLINKCMKLDHEWTWNTDICLGNGCSSLKSYYLSAVCYYVTLQFLVAICSWDLWTVLVDTDSLVLSERINFKLLLMSWFPKTLPVKAFSLSRLLFGSMVITLATLDPVPRFLAGCTQYAHNRIWELWKWSVWY